MTDLIRPRRTPPGSCYTADSLPLVLRCAAARALIYRKFGTPADGAATLRDHLMRLLNCVDLRTHKFEDSLIQLPGVLSSLFLLPKTTENMEAFLPRCHRAELFHCADKKLTHSISALLEIAVNGLQTDKHLRLAISGVNPPASRGSSVNNVPAQHGVSDAKRLSPSNFQSADIEVPALKDRVFRVLQTATSIPPAGALA